MNKLRRIVLVAMVVSLFSAVFMPGIASAQAGRAELLQDIPVSGALPDGGTFEGVLDITGFAFEDGELLVSGMLTGTATDALGVVTEITQTFTDITSGLLGSTGRCEVLDLDLGPIFLDLLGLELDLSEINLDLTAVSGPGNLLGNLLCAVTGLLDRGGPLSGITNLLDQINGLLG